MFLNEPILWRTVRNQFRYKRKVYMNFVNSLLLVQIISLILSYGGGGSMGTSSNEVSITMLFYSANYVIIFTMMWALIFAITLTTKLNRSMDFVFVSNRLSSHLSNVALLLTGSVIGGGTAFLSGYALKLVMYYLRGPEQTIMEPIGVSHLLIGIAATILYMLLICAIGYVIGLLVQRFKPFAIIIPAGILGIMIMETNTTGEPPTIFGMIPFFVQESSLAIFAIKVLFAAALLLAAAIGISNRMEVRS